MNKRIKENTKNRRKYLQKWFKENLQTIRALSGLTLADISFNTGISAQTLSLIENGRDISDYQYIVIRKYIESYLTDSLQYSNELMNDDDEISEILIKPVLAICISIICNDMGIWSQQEQSFIEEQWSLLKEQVQERKTAPTAKTYSKIFYDEFKNMKFTSLLTAFNYTVSNIPDVNDSSSDEYIFDYISFITQNEELKPIEKITIFVCIEIMLVLLLATPIDEVLQKSHLKITKESFTYYKNNALELVNKSLTNNALLEDLKLQVDSLKNPDNELSVTKLTLNQLDALLESIKNNSDELINEITNFIDLDFTNKENITTIEKLDLLLLDWLSLARSAIIKLSNINNWFFASTYKGVEFISVNQSHSSFIEYLYSINEERCTLNFNAIEELLIKEKIIEQ